MADVRLDPPRRGGVEIRNGIPYATSDTTLSLLPAAAQGEWLARNSDALHGTMLDLGCGNAPFREWYLQFVDRVVAYDPARLPGVDVVGLAERLPFRDESFDSVFTSEVLEHVADAEAAMREISRVLKPGGDLVVTVPFIYPVHEPPHDHRRFTHFGLRGILERYGFEVIGIQAKGNFGVLVMHWGIMVLVGASAKLSKKVHLARLLSDRTWFQRGVAAPQKVIIRRGVSCDVEGTASWATLGYMARARKISP